MRLAKKERKKKPKALKYHFALKQMTYYDLNFEPRPEPRVLVFSFSKAICSRNRAHKGKP